MNRDALWTGFENVTDSFVTIGGVAQSFLTLPIMAKLEPKIDGLDSSSCYSDADGVAVMDGTITSSVLSEQEDPHSIPAKHVVTSDLSGHPSEYLLLVKGLVLSPSTDSPSNYLDPPDLLEDHTIDELNNNDSFVFADHMKRVVGNAWNSPSMEVALLGTRGEYILALAHTIGGQPARGTEVTELSEVEYHPRFYYVITPGCIRSMSCSDR
jgi:hypothetical protein